MLNNSFQGDKAQKPFAGMKEHHDDGRSCFSSRYQLLITLIIKENESDAFFHFGDNADQALQSRQSSPL